ncbi:MBL fold metallo-hydrolase [Burkholderia cepacia]|uniref:ComEC/Rec2 family competence protein n=1 Tax=Burkholderia cepacia TaxID=292 RepID=UPI000CF045B4|nr:MBL fold metallo-hydrolase [Burkholderia cepacia]KAB1589997.1 MBL fold metallo-hydrolase [Burkholderia cepacia]
MSENTRKPFLRVVALPAGPGDCLWIEYGWEGAPAHVLLVDTGVPRTLEYIKPRLKALSRDQVTALVVTHIDDDHIGSACKLLSDETLAEKIRDVWFNGRRHCGPEDPNEPFGIKRALALDKLLGEGALRWNSASGGRAVALDDAGLPKRLPELEGEMQITILGPSAEQLVLLGERWDEAVEEMEQRAKAREKAASEPAPPPDMEVLGGPSIFDVDALSSYQGSDPSVTNGSSITLLLEFAGRSILLAGDSHAEPLLRAWRHLEKREVDLLKVSHHGSRNNTTLELINALQPSMALICTDGSSHGCVFRRT